MEYTCLSISPAFPRVGGKSDHVSSQGKEAVFATHDTYNKKNLLPSESLSDHDIITAFLELTLSEDKCGLERLAS